MIVLSIAAIASLVLGIIVATEGVLRRVFDYFDGAFWAFTAIGTLWFLGCGLIVVFAAGKLFG